MKVICVWKVPAVLTATFKRRMRTEKLLRQDSPATLLNHLSGVNYWYETDESFGDVTEFAADNICRSEKVLMRDFCLCMQDF